jgi:K+-transporting ATPase KdpF subunit
VGAADLLRQTLRGEEMSPSELIGLVIAALLLVYLFAALLKPEWFA